MQDVMLMDAVSPHPPEVTRVFKAIKLECDRQHVGEDRQAMLFEAYSILRTSVQTGFHYDSLLVLAGIVEPDNGGWYRQIPVYFEGFGQAPAPDVIPRAMENWIDYFNNELSDPSSKCVHQGIVDAIIKEFLDIHPFSDGNGRLAWLLRVWLLNQWDDPQPLPDYYGKE